MRSTPRDYSCDPALATMASSLTCINFEIGPDERLRFFELETLRNVSLFKDGRTYRARLCIGGKLRVLGITTDGPSAARYADCARVFFWQYRLRDCRPPVETDMNFSIAQAQHDIEHTPGVSELLVSIRDHLARFGELKIATDAGNGKRHVREQRRTARGELHAFLADITSDAAAREQEYAKLRADVETSFSELKKAFHCILERLTQLEAKQQPLFVGPAQSQTDTTPLPTNGVWWCGEKIS